MYGLFKAYDSDKIRFTAEGGLAVLLTNGTGSPSTKGLVLSTSTSTNNAVITTAASAINSIGVFYESGIPNGNEAWIVVDGIADVLLESTQDGVRGRWVGVSNEAGRVFTITDPVAPGFHNQELGHSIQTQTTPGGLMRIVMHHN